MSLINLKHDIRTLLSTQPWLLPLFGLRKINRSLLIRKSTDIVIEGYPRCANTFSVVAFCQMQAAGVKVAHHLHLPSQIMRAQRWRIPAILLIRDPLDAVVSLVIRHPELDVNRCLRDYQIFYGSLLGIIEYPVIADFGVVTSNYGVVIEEVNMRFGTAFKKFEHTDKCINSVFDEIEVIRKSANRSLSQIAVPNNEKYAKKNRIYESLKSNIDDDQLDHACKIYRKFLKHSVTNQ